MDQHYGVVEQLINGGRVEIMESNEEYDGDSGGKIIEN